MEQASRSPAGADEPATQSIATSTWIMTTGNAMGECILMLRSWQFAAYKELRAQAVN